MQKRWDVNEALELVVVDVNEDLRVMMKSEKRKVMERLQFKFYLSEQA